MITPRAGEAFGGCVRGHKDAARHTEAEGSEEGLGHRGGAERERTAAWRMGEPRRSFMSGLYGTVGRLHTPVREPAVAYRLQECCGDKSYALTECSSNHTAKAAVSV